MYEMFPSNYLTRTAMKTLWGTFPTICQSVSFLFAEQNPFLDDKQSFGSYMSHNPSGTSLKCLDHFSQVMNQKKFQQFDYGASENKQRYGQTTPPELALRNANGKVPVGLFIGDTDELADVKDASWIPTQIPDSIVFNKIYHYGHLTFMVGKDMQYLYDLKDLIADHLPKKLSLESY